MEEVEDLLVGAPHEVVSIVARRFTYVGSSNGPTMPTPLVYQMTIILLSTSCKIIDILVPFC